MSIIDEIKHVRANLRYKDRQQVITELTKLIHYVAVPCVKSGDKFTLFENTDAAMKFCRDKNLNQSAFNTVIKELESEGLIYGYTLSERGVYQLCIEK